jgi:hypothetical protein
MMPGCTLDRTAKGILASSVGAGYDPARLAFLQVATGQRRR